MDFSEVEKLPYGTLLLEYYRLKGDTFSVSEALKYLKSVFVSMLSG